MGATGRTSADLTSRPVVQGTIDTQTANPHIVDITPRSQVGCRHTPKSASWRGFNQTIYGRRFWQIFDAIRNVRPGSPALAQTRPLGIALSP